MTPFETALQEQLEQALDAAETPLKPICPTQECFRCHKEIPANWRPEQSDLFDCPYGVPWCVPGE